MAKKKKSSAARHKQQQKKQQRRQLRTHRRTVAPCPALQPITMLQPDNDLFDEIQPILAPLGALPDDAGTLMTRILPPALDSADLADEPEFAAIAIPPDIAVTTYITVLQEKGVADEDIDDLDEDERAEVIGEALDETTYRLLTPDLVTQLADAVAKSRARQRSAGHLNELSHLAAIQLILQFDQSLRMVAVLGVVQEFVRRGISAGFEMVSLVKQLVDRQGVNLEAMSPADFMASDLAAQLADHLAESPDLRRFLEQQSDQLVAQGRNALLTGDVDLNFFTKDEIDAFLALAATCCDGDLTAFAPDDPRLDSSLSVFSPQLFSYIKSLLTPERLAGLQQTLAELANDSDLQDEPWAPFLVNLSRDSKNPGIIDDLLDALRLHAFNLFLLRLQDELGEFVDDE